MRTSTYAEAMTVGMAIVGYLVIGSLAALLLAWQVKVLTDPDAEESRDPEFQSALAEAERAVSVMPGRMPGLLLAVVLLWPLWLVNTIKRRKS